MYILFLANEERRSAGLAVETLAQYSTSTLSILAKDERNERKRRKAGNISLYIHIV